MFLTRVTPINLIFKYLRKIIKPKCPEWLFLIVLVLMIKFTWIETNNVYWIWISPFLKIRQISKLALILTPSCLSSSGGRDPQAVSETPTQTAFALCGKPHLLPVFLRANYQGAGTSCCPLGLWNGVKMSNDSPEVGRMSKQETCRLHAGSTPFFTHAAQDNSAIEKPQHSQALLTGSLSLLKGQPGWEHNWYHLDNYWPVLVLTVGVVFCIHFVFLVLFHWCSLLLSM